MNKGGKWKRKSPFIEYVLSLKVGDKILSYKKDKDITSTLGRYDMKYTTKRLIGIDSTKETILKITEITILENNYKKGNMKEI